MTEEEANKQVAKKQALLECIDAVKGEAYRLALAKTPALEIQGRIRAVARAFLEGTKVYTASEIDAVVNALNVGKQA